MFYLPLKQCQYFLNSCKAIDIRGTGIIGFWYIWNFKFYVCIKFKLCTVIFFAHWHKCNPPPLRSWYFGGLGGGSAVWWIACLARAYVLEQEHKCRERHCESVCAGVCDRCQVSQVWEEVSSLVDSLISCLSGGTNHHTSTATWHFAAARCVYVCVLQRDTADLAVSVQTWYVKEILIWQDCRLCSRCVCMYVCVKLMVTFYHFKGFSSHSRKKDIEKWSQSANGKQS